MVMHVLDLASVAAGNPATKRHDDGLHSQDNSRNNESVFVAAVDIVLEGRTVVERAVVHDGCAAGITGILLLGGGEEDEGDDVEDDDKDGCGPPEDGEVLSQGVDLAKHTRHTADTHEKVDTGSNISSDLPCLVYLHEKGGTEIESGKDV